MTFTFLQIERNRVHGQETGCVYSLADPFTISELQNLACDVPELYKIGRSPDWEAQKL